MRSDEVVLSAWVARDPVSVALLAQARRAAQSRAPLLIEGEPGTGKDLLATIIHYLGSHPEEPLVRSRCSALPPDLLEREIFGFESPDGERVSRGRLELAGTGTVVLDEISALPFHLQERLLRAIDTGKFHRTRQLILPTASTSSGTEVALRARVVALTTTDLMKCLAVRIFREDLYYRLALVPLVIAPLRQRALDIRPLADYFVEQLCRIHAKPRKEPTPETLDRLERYGWPGNVTELRDFVTRTMCSSAVAPEANKRVPGQQNSAIAPLGLRMTLDEIESRYIAEILTFTQGKKSAAALILGISRKTLLEKRKRYGLT